MADEIKISALTSASTLTGAEELPVVQSSTTKKTTVDSFSSRFLPLSGGTMTGNISTPALLNLTPSTYSTGTIAQSGTTITITGGSFTSAYSGGWLVPSSGSPVRVFYTGSSSTIQASLSQTIAAGTTFTLSYANSAGIDQSSPYSIGLLANARFVGWGSGSVGSIQQQIWPGNGMFVNGLAIGDGRTTKITTGNPTASQSTTTVTGSGGNFAATDVGRLIMFAGGQTAFITGYTSATQVTVTPSQTVALQQYIIVGGTGSTFGGTSMDSRGNFGTENAYIHGLTTLGAGVVNAVTSVTAATYVDLVTDYTLSVNRAGAVAITLLAPTGSGRIKVIKDKSLAAATNNITITPASGTIDGAASLVINTNGGSFTLQDTSNGDWSII